MINRVKKWFHYNSVLFKQGRLQYLLRSCCYVFIFLVLCSFPILSGIYPLNYIPIILSVLLAIFVFTYLYWTKEIFITPMLLCLLLFALYTILVTLVGTRNFNMAFTLVSNVLIACVIAEFIASEHCGELILKFYAYAMLLFAIAFAFVYRNEILTFDSERIGDLFGNVNTVGFSIVMGGIAFCSLALRNKKTSLFYFIPAVLMFGLSFLTGSRSILVDVCLAMVLSIFLFFGKKKYWLSILTVLLIAVVGVVILSLPMFSALTDRIVEFISTFFGLGEGNYDYSGVTRFNMIVDGINIWSKNMFFGYGLESFIAHSSYETYSHSTLIEILNNSGLIGLTLFAIPVIKCSFLNKNNKNYSFGLMYLIAVIIPGMLMQVLIYNKSFYFSFSILLGTYETSVGGFRNTLFIKRKEGSLLPNFVYQKSNASYTKNLALVQRDQKL